jgi:hypothetical protein
MSRLEHHLSPAQIEWISLALFLSLFPISYCMYLHYKSLKRRYPGPIPPLRDPHAPREVKGDGEVVEGKVKAS